MKRQIVAWIFFLFTPIAATAAINGSAQLGLAQYAKNNAPAGQAALTMDIVTAAQLSVSPLPHAAVRAWGLFENGAQGFVNGDIDQAVVRFNTWDRGFLWVGRAFPLQETTESSITAIGSRWTQNQADALKPRLPGWVGVGQHLRFSKLSFDFAISPLFIPTRGPRLELSDVGPASGSRFAHLPPQWVAVNPQAILPLRYRLDTGDLAAILFQPQGFAATTFESGIGQWTALAWSAPAPDPALDSNARLRIESEDVLVTVKPAFPRETYAGMKWHAQELPLNPTAEIVHEFSSRQWIYSASVAPTAFLELGAIDQIGTTPSVPTQPAVIAPRYADALAWLRLHTRLESLQLAPSLRIERHFGKNAQDLWVNPELQYFPFNNFAAVASVSVLAGSDTSYFGAWRSLDHASLGVRVLW